MTLLAKDLPPFTTHKDNIRIISALVILDKIVRDNSNRFKATKSTIYFLRIAKRATQTSFAS